MNIWKATTLGLTAVLAIVVGSASVQNAGADRGKAQPQPMMQAALSSLRDAREHLNKATSDKGGFRVKALEHVNAAIEDVQKGIDYDNTHH